MAGNRSVLAPFLRKTYEMVDEASTDSVVSWSGGSNSFVVWNVLEFSKYLLPRHFKHGNFASFVRQLYAYGFRKVDLDRWEFTHEGFHKGRKNLLYSIKKRKASDSHDLHTDAKTSCGDGEIENIVSDMNNLLQGLASLKLHQQLIDIQLQTVQQRVQLLEDCQQKMTSFLAKGKQSSEVSSHLLQQVGGNTSLARGNKKRRLPDQEEEKLLLECGTTLSN